MNIRPRNLVVLFLASAVTGAVVGVGVFWSAVLRDTVAPLDPPKTTADLLVGKWKFVKRTPPRPAGYQSTIEFTREGDVTVLAQNPLAEFPDHKAGIYRLEGNTLWWIFYSAGGVGVGMEAIESITDDRFVAVGWGGGDRQVHEYERVR